MDLEVVIGLPKPFKSNEKKINRFVTLGENVSLPLSTLNLNIYLQKESLKKSSITKIK